MEGGDLDVVKVPEGEDLSQRLAELLQTAASEAIKNRGNFFVGLSGGSMVNLFRGALPHVHGEGAQWSRWRLLMCDERLVKEDSEHSTVGAYRAALRDSPLHDCAILAPDTDITDTCAAAEQYAGVLRAALGEEGPPRLDCALLGLGEDGHTASLFPGSPLLLPQGEPRWTAPVTDSPKPPPNRVTLTLHVLNAARLCVFPIAGRGKAAMVKRVVEDRDLSLPAALVRPSPGRLVWLLDSGAAALLP